MIICKTIYFFKYFSYENVLINRKIDFVKCDMGFDTQRFPNGVDEELICIYSKISIN